MAAVRVTVRQQDSEVRVRRVAVSKAVTFPGATTTRAICTPSHMPQFLAPIRSEVYLFILFTQQVVIECLCIELLCIPSNLKFLPIKYFSLTFHYKELQACGKAENTIQCTPVSPPPGFNT